MKNPGPSKHSGAPPPFRETAQLMSSSEIDRTLVRLAHEIVERHNGATDLVFVGILRRGVALAERLAKRITEIEKVTPPVGKLDITSYRDDLSPVDRKSIIQQSDLPFPMEDKNVILVDDVLYTGRSTRAALDALVDHGRPRRVELCVLIDRGHRELPIQPDYVGRVMQTTESESIEVHLREVNHEERVALCEKVSGN
jgi:pyrimidine operon attenuation protein/uracil phosphoribosyltransferase